jgi:polyhydroxyalkanoate synthase
MVGFLIGEGFDVYLLDWARAYPADAENTLETYVEDYIPRAMGAACAYSDTSELTLAGYCLGGVLALLLAASDPGPVVRNLVALATPCDFSELGFLSQMFAEGRLEPADVVDATGIVPARVLDQGFQSLKPTDALVQQVNVLQNLWNDQWLTGFIAMNKWARDQAPLPGAVLRQIVERLVRDNSLAEATVALGKREVSLGDIGCPFLNVFCKRDEIVPPRSAAPLTGLVGSEDVTELRLDSGHVGLVAGRQAAKIARPQIADWIRAHSERPAGSQPKTGRAQTQEKQRREASDGVGTAHNAAR